MNWARSNLSLIHICHFATHFNVSTPTKPCAPGLPFLDVDAEAGDASLLALDPSRVDAVDDLLACLLYTSRCV